MKDAASPKPRSRAICAPFILGALILASSPSLAAVAEPCQHPVTLSLPKWKFQLEVQESTATWSAKESAEALHRKQTQYFSDKSSPFLKQTGQSTLGFMTPNLKVIITPDIQYSRTLQGRYCATVLGAKATIIAKPEILLAKELTSRDCVSSAALAFQIDHVKILTAVLKEAQTKPEVFKEGVFNVYQPKGVAGGSQEEIAKGLRVKELEVEQAVFAKLGPYLRMQRKAGAETPARLNQLYQTCEGKFAQSASLVKN